MMKKYFVSSLGFKEINVSEVPFDGDASAKKHLALKHTEGNYSLIVFDNDDRDGYDCEMYGFADAAIGKFITYFLHKERLAAVPAFADFIKKMDEEVTKL